MLIPKRTRESKVTVRTVITPPRSQKTAPWWLTEVPTRSYDSDGTEEDAWDDDEEPEEESEEEIWCDECECYHCNSSW